MIDECKTGAVDNHSLA